MERTHRGSGGERFCSRVLLGNGLNRLAKLVSEATVRDIAMLHKSYDVPYPGHFQDLMSLPACVYVSHNAEIPAFQKLVVGVVLPYVLLAVIMMQELDSSLS